MDEPAHKTVLLAVDLGLRTGFAEFGATGRLLQYRSRHYPNRRILKQRAFRILRSRPRLQWLVLEGGGDLLRHWEHAAAKCGIEVLAISAETWRGPLMTKRHRRSGQEAKKHADALAKAVIEWSNCKRPTSLRHDAAEAILAGLWGCLDTGMLKTLPDNLKHLTGPTQLPGN